LDRGVVTAAAISNVVPEAGYALGVLCRRYFGVEPLVVGAPGVEIGVRALTERPDEVGADRLVNALAAHRLHPGPAIVIDFGTATTFDVIDRNGDYCGGVIAPGANLSLEALRMAAAKLPGVAIARPAAALGRTTTQAMQSGVFWGYVGLIEGITARITVEQAEILGPQAQRIATGGLAALFADATDAIGRVAPDLTLDGLRRVYELNGGVWEKPE
ncbi:MAG: type III pantothenate kinase, partial [Pseudomonadota bacterium]